MFHSDLRLRLFPLGVAAAFVLIAACTRSGVSAPVSVPAPLPSPPPSFAPLAADGSGDGAPHLGCVDQSPPAKSFADTAAPPIGVTVRHRQKGKGARPIMRVDGAKVESSWDAATGRVTHISSADLAEGRHHAEVSWGGRGCVWGFTVRQETPPFEDVGRRWQGGLVALLAEAPHPDYALDPARWSLTERGAPTVVAAAFVGGQPGEPEWVDLTLSRPIGVGEWRRATVAYDGAGGQVLWHGPDSGLRGGPGKDPGGGQSPMGDGGPSLCFDATIVPGSDILSQETEKSHFVEDFDGLYGDGGCTCGYELANDASWRTYAKMHLVLQPLDQEIQSQVDQTLTFDNQWQSGLTAGTYKIVTDWDYTSDITWTRVLTATEGCGQASQVTATSVTDQTVGEIDLGGAPGGAGHHPALVNMEFVLGAGLPYPLSLAVCPPGVEPEGNPCQYPRTGSTGQGRPPTTITWSGGLATGS